MYVFLCTPVPPCAHVVLEYQWVYSCSPMCSCCIYNRILVRWGYGDQGSGCQGVKKQGGGRKGVFVREGGVLLHCASIYFLLLTWFAARFLHMAEYARVTCYNLTGVLYQCCVVFEILGLPTDRCYLFVSKILTYNSFQFMSNTCVLLFSMQQFFLSFISFLSINKNLYKQIALLCF